MFLESYHPTNFQDRFEIHIIFTLFTLFSNVADVVLNRCSMRPRSTQAKVYTEAGSWRSASVSQRCSAGGTDFELVDLTVLIRLDWVGFNLIPAGPHDSVLAHKYKWMYVEYELCVCFHVPMPLGWFSPGNTIFTLHCIFIKQNR